MSVLERLKKIYQQESKYSMVGGSFVLKPYKSYTKAELIDIAHDKNYPIKTLKTKKDIYEVIKEHQAVAKKEKGRKTQAVKTKKLEGEIDQIIKELKPAKPPKPADATKFLKEYQKSKRPAKPPKPADATKFLREYQNKKFLEEIDELENELDEAIALPIKPVKPPKTADSTKFLRELKKPAKPPKTADTTKFLREYKKAEAAKLKKAEAAKMKKDIKQITKNLKKDSALLEQDKNILNLLNLPNEEYPGEKEYKLDEHAFRRTHKLLPYDKYTKGTIEALAFELGIRDVLRKNYTKRKLYNMVHENLYGETPSKKKGKGLVGGNMNEFAMICKHATKNDLIDLLQQFYDEDAGIGEENEIEGEYEMPDEQVPETDENLAKNEVLDILNEEYEPEQMTIPDQREYLSREDQAAQTTEIQNEISQRLEEIAQLKAMQADNDTLHMGGQGLYGSKRLNKKLINKPLLGTGKVGGSLVGGKLTYKQFVKQYGGIPPKGAYQKYKSQ